MTENKNLQVSFFVECTNLFPHTQSYTQDDRTMKAASKPYQYLREHFSKQGRTSQQTEIGDRMGFTYQMLCPR